MRAIAFGPIPVGDPYVTVADAEAYISAYRQAADDFTIMAAAGCDANLALAAVAKSLMLSVSGFGPLPRVAENALRAVMAEGR